MRKMRLIRCSCGGMDLGIIHSEEASFLSVSIWALSSHLGFLFFKTVPGYLPKVLSFIIYFETEI